MASVQDLRMLKCIICYLCYAVMYKMTLLLRRFSNNIYVEIYTTLNTSP